MMDRLLHRHLAPVARDHRRVRLLWTLTLGWAAAAVAGLALIGLHRSFAWSSAWMLFLWAVATVAFSLGAWWRNLRQPPDLEGIVRQIETENPSLHAQLLTAIEQRPEPGSKGLNFLQERLIREALQQDRDHGWHSRVRKRLKNARLAGVVTLFLLFLVIQSLQQVVPRQGLIRALVQGGLVVTPGDTSLEKGNNLVVLARFGSDVPKEATLVLRPANEPERRIPLNRNLSDPIFGASVPAVQADLVYRVEYGSSSTREFRVSVFEFPRLERADARVRFPDYTALPEKRIEDTRRVSAVEGSAVDYAFQLNKPVRTATLVSKDRPAITLQPATNRPALYTSSFKLETSGRYELVLVDDAGRTNRLPPLFVFEALTNRAPDLKFAFPRGDQRVSPLEEMHFQGEAVDDFGLKAYGIAYNLAGAELKSVQLGGASGPHEKKTLEHVVALESLRAQPDQLLSYHLWADDIGPDGQLRHTVSDIFFAEVRPFDEVFREGQAQDPNQAEQQQQQQQGQQGNGGAERLAELQKQIITATWNLQRRGAARGSAPDLAKDATTVKESQEKALEQLRTQQEQQDDARQGALLDAVAQEMEKAATALGQAASGNSVKPLSPALAAEQSAYQALLRLAAREHQVAQGRSNQRGQSNRGSRAQRQIDQLQLRQTQNRYETERQAAAPQTPEQREQVQAFSRLKELAQRQQDVNERLRELQSALQEARSEAEREELRARLKRLQEEQQQMLADVDELRQRMERPENQSQMADSRSRLEQTRSEVQRAADAMNRADTSQALSSGTRAQRDLQQMRDDFRRQTSSQFGEDMRSLRNQARELSRQQEDIGQKMESLTAPDARKTLTDADERKELASQLESQKQRMEELVKQATDVTVKAEPVEPLLSRQLYDTLRKAAQDDPRNLQETADDLLAQGRLLRSVYDRLRGGKDDSRKAVEVAANLLREGFPNEASNLEQRARRSVGELKAGVERAAESVLGDDTEALRRARDEVDALSRQLEQEMARGQGQGGTNSARAASSAERGEQGAQGRRDQQQANAGPGAADERRGGNSANRDPSGNAQAGDRQAQREARDGQPGQEGQGQRELAAGDGQRGAPGTREARNRDGQPQGDRQRGARDGGGARNFVDQLGGPEDGGRWGGPLTGPEFTQWSDRLRDVEEMLDVPELRAEVARIRDRARVTRLNMKRHNEPPQWDIVNVQIAGPLTALRSRITDELARRESREAVVPIDRDPVPPRYAERVKTYYEQLGKSE